MIDEFSGVDSAEFRTFGQYVDFLRRRAQLPIEGRLLAFPKTPCGVSCRSFGGR